MGALEPPPSIVDPELQVLTFDQLAQLVNEVNPEVFYGRALEFEVAAERYEQIQDDLDRESRNMWEGWSGRIAESFDDLVRQVSGLTAAVSQVMSNPGYGVAMRRAGDALVQAQQRMRDLQAQNRRNDLEAARQVLHDLGTAYRDIGTAMTPMPDMVTGLQAVTGYRITLGAGLAAVVPPVASGQQQGAGEHQDAGEHRERTGAVAGGVAGLVAFTSPGAHHRPGPVVHGRQPASPGASPREADCVVPVVLGRGAPEAPSKAGEPQGGSQRVDAAAAVLGRPPRAGKMGVHASPKKKKRATERPATTESAEKQQGKPEVAAEGMVATSAGPSHHDVRSAEAPQMASTAGSDAVPAPAPAPAAAGSAAPAAAVSEPPVQKPAPTVPTAHLPVSGHVAPVSPAGSAASPGMPVHGPPSPAGTTSSAGALPASPAFQPVAAGGNAEVAGMPPVVPGAGGASRFGGDHAATGGFMGGMMRGGHGQDDHPKERDPADFLGGEPGVWNSGGGGAPVLGRPVNPPRPVDDDELAGIKELANIKDPEVLRVALGRIKQLREGRED